MTKTDFTALLDRTRKAFEASDIKVYADKYKHVWNYSVAATPIKQNRLLLIGFNWGATSGKSYKPQSEVPEKWFMEMENKHLGSFNRVKSRLATFRENDLEEVGQSNFCFFRSDKDGQISARDLELSAPLFEQFLAMARPKEILGFSSRLRDHLVASEQLHNLQLKNIPYQRGEKTFNCKVVRGSYHVGEREVPVSLLPHPNSPLPTDVRKAAWEFCSDS